MKTNSAENGTSQKSVRVKVLYDYAAADEDEKGRKITDVVLYFVDFERRPQLIDYAELRHMECQTDFQVRDIECRASLVGSRKGKVGILWLLKARVPPFFEKEIRKLNPNNL